MAEIAQKTTHKRAQGRRTNGKTTRRAGGRQGRGAKPASLPRKTAPAKAEKSKKNVVAGKRILAAANHQHAPVAADSGRSPESESRGLDRLTEQVDKMLNRNCKVITEALARQIAEGKPGIAKVAFSLAGQMKRKPEMETDQLRNQEILQDLAAQPEYQEPAKNDESDDPQPGILESVHAVEES
jgi:hypothetical protein